MANISEILHRVDIGNTEATIKLNQRALATLIPCDPDAIVADGCKFQISLDLRKRGIEQKIIAGTLMPDPDPTLQRTLTSAYLWFKQITKGTPIGQIAKDQKTSESLIRTRLRLAFLAPKIQAAILNGTQPADLTLAKILRVKVDPDCEVQHKQLGF